MSSTDIITSNRVSLLSSLFHQRFSVNYNCKILPESLTWTKSRICHQDTDSFCIIFQVIYFFIGIMAYIDLLKLLTLPKSHNPKYHIIIVNIYKGRKVLYIIADYLKSFLARSDIPYLVIHNGGKIIDLIGR